MDSTCIVKLGWRLQIPRLPYENEILSNETLDECFYQNAGLFWLNLRSYDPSFSARWNSQLKRNDSRYKKEVVPGIEPGLSECFRIIFSESDVLTTTLHNPLINGDKFLKYT